MSMPNNANNHYAERIRINGLVQGVGFRPTVWQLAKQFNVHGEVRNDGSGVQIIACSRLQNIDQLIRKLQLAPPALARIDSIQREVIEDALAFNDFTIVKSVSSSVHTGMVADAATCEACLQDINDPANRRYGYPFTNCTHCGPRLSIVSKLPYDRANTSMAKFTQCKSCQQEYDTPDDRRFHAQPNACPDCGPKIWLTDNKGETISSEHVINETADLIRQGKIVAIKSIGGFQLCCDASNEQAVQQLRKRKNRPHKAFALMASSMQQVSRYCCVSSAESELLKSTAAPIVLLDKLTDATILANSIAATQTTLGFMLPNSPLHHLLLQQLDVPVIMTSGNIFNQPQCIDNQQALDQLGDIADIFLMHDRDIVNRIDDSVTQIIDSSGIHFYRRARGYAPAPIKLADEFSALNIVACGSEMKNTFCLLRDGNATVSQHIGNLENAQTWDDYLHNQQLYQRLYQFTPQAIAVDLHPEYRASIYGRQLANELSIPVIEVQHHHAHIASCLVDNNWPPEQGKVIGVAMDGLGFGTDGSIWGGEFLLTDYIGFERRARIKPTPMPGGNQASLEPWRNTFAQLQTHCNWEQIAQHYAALTLIQSLIKKPLPTLQQMMLKGFNSPLSSSCGRLFDAVAFTLGICPERQSYEGQAAIELEALLQDGWQAAEAYPFTIEQNDLLEINPQPMWSNLLDDLQAGVNSSIISARFHQGLAQVIVDVVRLLGVDSHITTVALSGGVFQNKSLLLACRNLLQQQSFKVLIQQQLPPNDGGLSLGQAAIAAARTANLQNEN